MVLLVVTGLLNISLYFVNLYIYTTIYRLMSNNKSTSEMDKLLKWLPLILVMVSSVTAFAVLKTNVQALETEVNRNKIECDAFQTSIADKMEKLSEDINDIKITQEGIKKDTEYIKQGL